MVESWAVLTEAESMSDHLYIEMGLWIQGRPRRQDQRRWSVKKMNEDLMIVGLLIVSWPRREEGDALIERIERYRESLFLVCDLAMPRLKVRPRRATYWWSEDISDLRKVAIRSRRKSIRARQMRRDPDVIDDRRSAYKEDKKALGRAICRAKSASWDELLLSLWDDPWGLAYRIVRDKLRRWELPVTETLDPGFLNTVIETLFPEPPDREREEDAHAGQHSIEDVPGTTSGKSPRRKQPGPSVE